MSERETLESDCQQMNDIVAALSAADNDSLDSLPSRCILGEFNISMKRMNWVNLTE